MRVAQSACVYVCVRWRGTTNCTTPTMGVQEGWNNHALQILSNSIYLIYCYRLSQLGGGLFLSTGKSPWSPCEEKKICLSLFRLFLQNMLLLLLLLVGCEGAGEQKNWHLKEGVIQNGKIIVMDNHIQPTTLAVRNYAHMFLRSLWFLSLKSEDLLQAHFSRKEVSESEIEGNDVEIPWREDAVPPLLNTVENHSDLIAREEIANPVQNVRVFNIFPCVRVQ